MQSVHGNFNIFRTKDGSGKDAILLVPSDDLPLTYCPNEEDETAEVAFERVLGGTFPADSYLTLRYTGGGSLTIHLGPDFQKAAFCQ